MKRNTNPLISIVIPAYNSEKYIGETIDSVLNQTYENFELLIVDDESNDKTPEIIKQYKDSRIKYYRIPHSGRPSVPRNFGIQKADGELIAFLDSDDLWTKNKLENQIIHLEKNSEAAFVYSMSVTFGTSIFSQNYEVLPLLHKAVLSRDDLLKKGNSITCSSVLIRKEMIEAVNGFDEDPELKAIEDYDLWLRLSKDFKFCFIPKIHVYYRVHSTQTSGDWEIKRQRINYLAKKRNLNLPNYNYYRNKGFVFLILRSFVHFLTYLWVQFTCWFS